MLGRRLKVFCVAVTVFANFNNTVVAQTGGKPVSPKEANLISRSRVPPALTGALTVLGDRLEKAGKERLVLSGTITTSKSPQPQPIVIATELPGRIRIERGSGADAKTVGFDGTNTWSSKGATEEDDMDLLESLLSDTPDRILFLSATGRATHHYGDGYRTDNGWSPSYQGPFYTVIGVFDSLSKSSIGPEKLFYFNSTSQLLEKVRYTKVKAGADVRVETQIEGWNSVDGQRTPASMKRVENGAVVWQITVSSPGLQPAGDTQTFARP